MLGWLGGGAPSFMVENEPRGRLLCGGGVTRPPGVKWVYRVTLRTKILKVTLKTPHTLGRISDRADFFSKIISLTGAHATKINGGFGKIPPRSVHKRRIASSAFVFR